MEIPLTSIPCERVTPTLPALFDIRKPTMPRAFNLLEGLNRGQILVDDPDHPTCAVVRDVMFRKSFDYQPTLDLFGSVESVLQRTFSVVILDGETIACEAATGAPTHGWIEVGVITAEPYRRQGFATMACKRLIEMCEAQGHRTWWDCAKQNTVSVKLAKKPGYLGDQEYRPMPPAKCTGWQAGPGTKMPGFQQSTKRCNLRRPGKVMHCDPNSSQSLLSIWTICASS